MAKTLGFYQNFNLDLQRLSKALRCVQSEPEMGHLALSRCMGVNQPVAEGFTSWLRHTGLIANKSSGKLQMNSNQQLTPFGEIVSRYDPMLSGTGTQWLLHYYLATEHSERSDAWNILINKYLSLHSSFTAEQFQLYFIDLMSSMAKNRMALSKDPLAALSTYVRVEALAQLHILEKQDKMYVVGRPNLPHILVVGYMLFDWWRNHYDQTNTLRFSQLCYEDESIGRICSVDQSQVRRFVFELASLGYLSFSETQHEPVNRLYQDLPHTLLESYYSQR